MGLSVSEGETVRRKAVILAWWVSELDGPYVPEAEEFPAMVLESLHRLLAQQIGEILAALRQETGWVRGRAVLEGAECADFSQGMLQHV